MHISIACSNKMSSLRSVYAFRKHCQKVVKLFDIALRFIGVPGVTLNEKKYIRKELRSTGFMLLLKLLKYCLNSFLVFKGA